jgi:hypothetical protein
MSTQKTSAPGLTAPDLDRRNCAPICGAQLFYWARGLVGWSLCTFASQDHMNKLWPAAATQGG